MEVGLFAAGWLLMIVAMMLPSSIPLVVTFAALVGRAPPPAAGRAPAGRLSRRLGWLRPRGLGPGPGIHGAVELPWLAAHPQLIMATTLLAAGLWQFSPLRARCLDSAVARWVVMNRWRGTSKRVSLRDGDATGRSASAAAGR